ncbi:MAG TPA: YbaK/EbsC family protein, partial [Solirubrobacterales bacterium]|nr:YbaK/EbsC family protein [Solirubrobacterales bacterium]
IAAVSELLGVPAGALVKALPMVSDAGEPVLVLGRGDHRLNEIKLRNALGADFRPARAEEIEAELGPVGFVGPVGASVPVYKDAAIQGDSFVAGANRPDAHLRGVRPGRDFEFEELDVRAVEAGDTAPGGGTIEIEPAIEIGNIFKLGTRYSEPLGATYLDEGGAERPIVMGSYGIGPARIVAAAIEQGADERGIVWPAPLAPWQLQLVSLAKGGEPEREAADRLYEELRGRGAEVLYDDRDAGPGEKLTDAELLGCPLRVVVGRRGLAEGVVEATRRAGGEEAKLPVEEAAERALELLASPDG